MWLTRPTIALATTATLGQTPGKPDQTFGNPGDLVVLEPERWIGQHFSLVDHIDIGPQLTAGPWIVLLVHHDCDHCIATVPRYVAAFGTQSAPHLQPPTLNLQPSQTLFAPLFAT